MGKNSPEAAGQRSPVAPGPSVAPAPPGSAHLLLSFSPLLFSSDGGGLNWGEDPLAARSGRRDGVWYIKGGTLGFGGVE
jgi:hypothetical protein